MEANGYLHALTALSSGKELQISTESENRETSKPATHRGAPTRIGTPDL